MFSRFLKGYSYLKLLSNTNMIQMKFRLLFFHLLLLFFFVLTESHAQFPPAAGKPGTTAMFTDSSAFTFWAKGCTISRGFVNIADTTFTYNGSNKATYGQPADALGKADNYVVSLGDGGSAILTFEDFIINGPGFDFAVFENSLDGSFLELAFVEVSSDGDQYFRFPAASYSPVSLQTHTFGSTDPTKINNLAGKYIQLHGTPFDLDTLKGIPGLDINHVSHVKIIDVTGNILDPYATFDSQGNRINDPWPTPFNTGGFDLDAVGGIHGSPNSISKQTSDYKISVFPNPVSDFLTIKIPENQTITLVITMCSGTEVEVIRNISGNRLVNLTFLSPGVYIALFSFPDGTRVPRKIIKL
jgi:hypothetical protein